MSHYWNQFDGFTKYELTQSDIDHIARGLVILAETPKLIT